jgi:hypothetical protein
MDQVVELYHPHIDDGRRVITVPESAVSQHMRSGWLRVQDAAPRDVPPGAAGQQNQGPADAGAVAKDQPKRRRGQNEEGQ